MQSQFLHIKILDAINNGYMIRMSLNIYNYSLPQKIQLPQNTVSGLLGGVSKTSLSTNTGKVTQQGFSELAVG